MGKTIKPLENCIMGVGKLIEERAVQSIGKQFNCMKDDHRSLVSENSYQVSIWIGHPEDFLTVWEPLMGAESRDIVPACTGRCCIKHMNWVNPSLGDKSINILFYYYIIIQKSLWLLGNLRLVSVSVGADLNSSQDRLIHWVNRNIDQQEPACHEYSGGPKVKLL